METRIWKDMIAVIRIEQQRRASLLTDEDPDFADDQWLFTDEPFVNELCLMLLVALRHQVEREQVRLAARAADGGKEISREKYQEKVREVREKLRKDGWKKISSELNLKSCEGYTCMEALRQLVNLYKHDPSMEPDEKLLKLLKLETGVNYLPLPESHKLQKGLAAFIDLGKDAAYCDIVERFVDIAIGFLADVPRQVNVSPVKKGTVSFNPKDAAR